MSFRAAVRGAWTRYLRRREAAVTRKVLRILDDVALRDLGIRPGEIDSVAAEAAAIAERTRLRLGRAKGG